MRFLQRRCRWFFLALLLMTLAVMNYRQYFSSSPRRPLPILVPSGRPSQGSTAPPDHHNLGTGAGVTDDGSIRERLQASEHVYQTYMTQRKEALKNPEVKSAIFHGEDYIWDYFRPTFSCPWTTQSLGWGGGSGGGKWVCGLELFEDTSDSTPCVVYSFGAGGDSSFEADILRRTPCSVFVFDGTKQGFLGPEITEDLKDRITLTRKNVRAYDSRSTTTLSSAMASNGHTFIDILKIDVEGSEFDVLNQVLASGSPAPFGQLALEVHLGMKKDIDAFLSFLFSKSSFEDLVSLWDRMEEGGLRAFMLEPNFHGFGSENKMHAVEYAFINVKRASRIVPYVL